MCPASAAGDSIAHLRRPKAAKPRHQENLRPFAANFKGRNKIPTTKCCCKIHTTYTIQPTKIFFSKTKTDTQHATSSSRFTGYTLFSLPILPAKKQAGVFSRGNPVGAVDANRANTQNNERTGTSYTRGTVIHALRLASSDWSTL